MERTRGGLLLALSAVGLWGASFAAVRVALEAFTPAGLVAARLTLGALALHALLAARGAHGRPPVRALAAALALGAILGVHLGLQAFGLRFTTAVQTGWIVAAMPAAIALGAVVFQGARLRASAWGGMAVATVGVATIAGFAPPDFERAPLGNLLQVVSCVTWAAYTLVGASVVSRLGPLRTTAWAATGAALVAGAAALGTGSTIATPDARALVALAFLAFGCNALAQLLWLTAVERAGATRAGATLYVEPLVTLAAGVALLSEPVTATTLAGGALVLVGTFAVTRR